MSDRCAGGTERKTVNCPHCGSTNDLEAVERQGVCHDCREVLDIELEREAFAIESIYNNAKPSYSPELEWFAMGLDHDRDQEQFVFQSEKYIDREGIEALRDAGRKIRYIEAHDLRDEVLIQIAIDVTGDIPDTGNERDPE